jgi:sugar-specific transcriptional regulator TrmB
MMDILLLNMNYAKMKSNMVDKMEITKSLEKLGLNLSEIDVYYELLYVEKLSILELSKKLNIPRTTIYRICEKLSQKGFLTWVVSNNGKDVKAVRAENLKFLVEEQKAKLKEVDSSIMKLRDFSNEIMMHVPKTEIRYYQGRDGMRQLIWNCLRAEKEIVGYSEFGRVSVVGEDFYDSYVKEFKLRGLKDRAITNDSGLKYVEQFVVPDKHQLALDNIRQISKDVFYVSGDHSIYNNTYAICYWNQGEIVGMEIENPELVMLHRSIFELLWGIAKPVF